MGKLSYHFKRKDFACKCGKCENEFKISLGIVGALEHIKSKLRKKVIVLKGYQCPESVEAENSIMKNYHGFGKAVDFKVKGASIKDIYKIVADMPEITGIGIYPNADFVHIDIRDNKRTEWVFERKENVNLSETKKKQYGLI